MESFISYVTEEEIRRERARARELRKTQWWKRKCAAGICHYCRKKVSPREMTMDHMVPVIRGGKSTKGNLVAVCKDCNDKKKYLLPIEWEEYLELLAKEEI
jgi:5-methylcytosine-specific restriction endonuclease McrA